MTKKGKSINQIETKTATQWKKRAKQDKGNRKNISRAQKFALELLDYLDENKIKQKELAELMGVSPQQVNKILSAKANLTFDTLDKIADALKIKISSPVIETQKIVRSQNIRSVMKVVHNRNSKPVDERFSTSSAPEKNPVLETTIENMEYYDYTAVQI